MCDKKWYVCNFVNLLNSAHSMYEDISQIIYYWLFQFLLALVYQNFLFSGKKKNLNGKTHITHNLDICGDYHFNICYSLLKIAQRKKWREKKERKRREEIEMESVWVLISLITIFFRIISKIHSVLPIIIHMTTDILYVCVEKVKNKKYKKETFFDMPVQDLILESFAVEYDIAKKKFPKNHHKSRTDQKLYNK